MFKIVRFPSKLEPFFDSLSPRSRPLAATASPWLRKSHIPIAQMASILRYRPALLSFT